MKNTNLLYGIMGLLLGIFIMAGYYSYNDHYRESRFKDTMHRMPDGKMMSNDDMSMESMISGMMAGLEGKKGDEFDKEFLSEMIVHHQGAVDMARAVLATSKRPELLKLANDIISTQTKEINMMEEWQKAWFK